MILSVMMRGIHGILTLPSPCMIHFHLHVSQVIDGVPQYPAPTYDGVLCAHNRLDLAKAHLCKLVNREACVSAHPCASKRRGQEEWRRKREKEKERVCVYMCVCVCVCVCVCGERDWRYASELVTMCRAL